MTRHTLPPEFKWRYTHCAYVPDDADDSFITRLAMSLHGLRDTVMEKAQIIEEKSGPWAWSRGTGATSNGEGMDTMVIHLDIGDTSEFCVFVNVSDDATLWREPEDCPGQPKVQPEGWCGGPDGSTSYEDYELTVKDIVDLLNRRKKWLREGAMKTSTRTLQNFRFAKSDELAHILDRVTAHQQGIRPITDDCAFRVEGITDD